MPFHPAGDRPRAICPVCHADRNDNRKKKLYGVRGCLTGSYHPDIPKNFFETPPVSIENEGEEREALRVCLQFLAQIICVLIGLQFQYMSLARFATHMLAKNRDSAKIIETAKKEAADGRTTQRKLELELESVKKRTIELEKCEKELKPWKEREDKIKHYLGVFTEVTRCEARDSNI